MKKFLLSSLVVLGLGASIIIVSCKEKNNNNITPTYRNQSTGTGANPCLFCVTVTGTSTPQSPATANSSLPVGGTNPGWSFVGCAASPNTLTGINGSTQVQILFGGVGLTIGTFAFTSGIPTSGQARMTVNNAPNQPAGIVWYSKSGTVTTNTTTTGWTATFNNIGCTQASPYIFPVVSVSGNLSCS